MHGHDRPLAGKDAIFGLRQVSSKRFGGFLVVQKARFVGENACSIAVKAQDRSEIEALIVQARG